MTRSSTYRRTLRLAVTGVAVTALAAVAAPGAALAAPALRIPVPAAPARTAGAPAAAASAFAKAGRDLAARRHAAVTLPAAARLVSALQEGETLGPGMALTSPSGEYSLVMSADGSLLRQKAANFLNPAPYAATIAAGPAGSRLVLQTDGNLVLYTPTNVPVFSSRTGPGTGEQLVMQDDGNAVLYAQDVSVLFVFPTQLAGLLPGATLLPGEGLSSADGGTRLIMQADGNLVLYKGGVAQFATQTSATGAGAVLQGDGNFVVYSPSRTPLFDTHTSSGSGLAILLVSDGEFRVVTIAPGSEVVGFGSAWGTSTFQPNEIFLPGDRRTAPGGIGLILQSDGNLVEYVNGAVRFSTSTQASLGFMQPDGNFVLYRFDQTSTGPTSVSETLVPVFDTHTAGFPGSRLVVQTDTNLVVYTPVNRPVYSSQH